MVGVSRDEPADLVRFREKYELPFLLLSDPERKAHEAYGVWGEKVLYGKKTMGVIRTTFIIGADGKIERVFPKVDVDGHVAEVLAAL